MISTVHIVQLMTLANHLQILSALLLCRQDVILQAWMKGSPTAAGPVPALGEARQANPETTVQTLQMACKVMAMDIITKTYASAQEAKVAAHLSLLAVPGPVASARHQRHRQCTAVSGHPAYHAVSREQVSLGQGHQAHQPPLHRSQSLQDDSAHSHCRSNF